MKITVRQESITRPEVDAIVNPANSFGYMGGGVAKVIKDLGGEQIEQEAIENSPIEIGEALPTTSGDLKSKHVLHCPTMRDPGARTELWYVRQATQAALEKAEELGHKTIAFPGLGTGVGGVDHDEAASEMIKTIKKFKPNSLEEVILVDIDEKMVNAWNKQLEL